MSDASQSPAYRPCVGIALFNAAGQVFVGERIDNPGAWQMPQGGIDPDEPLEQAAFRELEEEIGTGKAEIIRIHEEKWSYDFPDHLRRKLYGGKYHGQVQTWIAMRFTGMDSDIDLAFHTMPEFRAWQWVDLDRVFDLIVPFKRDIYQKIVAAFGDVPDSL
ncbi:MAG: RNA pyrophosphohydrolase [Rhodospirillales bacterium]|nr:RNA pyrophosphohydrolase [Rhodospirillales bacterium]